jgi:hypothetical protein
MTGRTREELEHLLDDAEQRVDRYVDPGSDDLSDAGADALSDRSALAYELRTICSHCHRSEADDHYDREGIYAGRWHDRCATPADLHRANYRWTPGDEALEEA